MSNVNESLDNLIAAKLSDAAYTALSVYQSIGEDDDGLVPIPVDQGGLDSGLTDWQADTDYSKQDNIGDQFITFVNNTTKQVVIAFKGTTPKNGYEDFSDLKNAGTSAWQDIESLVNGVFQQIKTAYPGYQIFTDGHSLGGGLAQAFALENNLSGYGQNSLPVTQAEIQGDNLNSTTLLNTWKSSGNNFSEVNDDGDVATDYFATPGGLAEYGGFYLDSTPASLSNPDGVAAAYDQQQLEAAMQVGSDAAEVWSTQLLRNAVAAHGLSTLIPAEINDPAVANGVVSADNPVPTDDDTTIDANALASDNSSILVGAAGGKATIDGISLTQGGVIIGRGDGNTLIAGTQPTIEYAPGNNETFDGGNITEPMTSNYGIPPNSVINTYDVLIGAPLDPSAQATPSTGTDTFNAGTTNNVMIGGSGTNIFNIPTAYSGYDNLPVNVVWGDGGTSTYNFTSGELVAIVYMTDPTVAALSDISISELEASIDQPGSLYQGANYDGLTVIINPTANDTITLNGIKLTGASYGTIGSLEDETFVGYEAKDIYYQADQPGWLTASQLAPSLTIWAQGGANEFVVGTGMGITTIEAHNLVHIPRWQSYFGGVARPCLRLKAMVRKYNFRCTSNRCTFEGGF